MKLICHENNRKFLMERLQTYSHIDVVLVEKGYAYEGLCYVFSMDNIDQLFMYLNQIEEKCLYGYMHNREYKINPKDIMYIEGFSKEAYIHCVDKQYQTDEKLYELEERLNGYDFVRINKSMILNMKYVEYIMPDVQSRYVVVLKNKEKLIVTRNYALEFKKKWKERKL